MAAQILDGLKLANTIKDQLREEVQHLKNNSGAVPVLVNVMTGMDSRAATYAQAQKRVAAYIGIRYELAQLPLHISQQEFMDHIYQLNEDKNIHGIMIHKPVPHQINYRQVANCVDTLKDLEGINVKNVGRMLLGESKLIPCTPAAVMAHLKAAKIPLRGKEVVMIGHSEIVGKPLSLLLLQEFATVTICHIATSEARRLEEHVNRAEILIVAVGKAGLVPGEWIRPGAVVIDVGINQVGEKIIGDVVFETAQKRASLITPVPGGVGPVTVVMLMKNGIEAFKIQMQVKDGIRV